MSQAIRLNWIQPQNAILPVQQAEGQAGSAGFVWVTPGTHNFSQNALLDLPPKYYESKWLCITCAGI